jgi:hypothetical protein
MRYPAGISGKEYAAMEEGYEQGVAEGRAERARIRAEAAEAVTAALDQVERRIREQAEVQPLGSMAWRAHMADVAHVSEVRRWAEARE